MKFSSTLLLPLALSAQAIPLHRSSSTVSLEPRLNINNVLGVIADLFPVNIALDVASGVIQAADQVLAILLGLSTTYEDLSDGKCGDVTLIFARGTDEPGNVGALVGPEFYQALESALGSSYTAIFQGVDDYEASVNDYLEGGSTTGASNMASLVTLAFAQCPNTKVVMSGYSQGAQVVHDAASALPAATMEKVSAIVTYGDPDSGTPVANIDSSKVLVICHDGDDICNFGVLITLAHLTYAANVTAAATWVVDTLGL